MSQLRVCFLSGFLALAVCLSAQENCANGIDDDGDGLIDLNDVVDCGCALPSRVPSLLPNPSLEEFAYREEGCVSLQPGGLPDLPNQANCLVGWEQASWGTTDAWNAFTLPGFPPFWPARLPQPLPNGTGVAGFWVGVRDSDDTRYVNQDSTVTTRYREYLAGCLPNGGTLVTDSTYRLRFSLGFMEPQELTSNAGTTVQVSSPSGVELAVYGIRSCGQLNFGGFYGCPEESGAAGYELLTTVRVTGSPGAWTPVQVDIRGNNDYAGIAIGGSCADDIAPTPYYRNYYFIDDVTLNEPAAFAGPVAGPVSVEGLSICADEITLRGQSTSGAAYQWYKDGVALLGQTDLALVLLPTPDIDGRYSLRVTTAAGCALTEEVVVQRPITVDMVPDSVALCPQLDTVFLYPTRTQGATFEWSDGSTEPYFLVTAPGDYRVTVSTVCEQRVESFTAVQTDEISATWYTEPAVFCAGDTVTLLRDSPWYIYGSTYTTLDNQVLFPGPRGDLEFTAGEYDSLVVTQFYGCSSVTDTIDVRPDESFAVTAAITNLDCNQTTGIIELTVANADPSTVEFTWVDANGEPTGVSGPRLTTDTPGQYTVELADGVHCPGSYTYEVIYADSFFLNLLLDSLSCGSDGSARLAPEGRVGPFQASWYRGDAPTPFAADTLFIDGLDAGDYRVEVTAADGCQRSERFTLAPPDTLTAVPAVVFADCDDPSSGSIVVTAGGGVPPYQYRLDTAGYQADPVFSNLGPGTYLISVRDSRGCTPVEAPVRIAEPTPFDLSLPREVTLSLGDSILLEVAVNGVAAADGYAVWAPAAGVSYPFGAGSTRVNVRPTRTTRYEVTFTSAEGCVESADVLVVVDESIRIYVPNAFSPNGDEQNDELRVYPGPAVNRILSFEVYNRWGSKVYAWSGEPEAGWDGTLDGQPLNTGVYFYVAVAELYNGSTTSLSGAVHLLR